MEFDVANMAARDRVNLVNSLVVPRPIAWVSTLDKDGIGNLSPFSYFNLVSSSPAVVMFALGGTGRADGHATRKDTLDNVVATEEFVVNVVGHDLRHPMSASSAEVAADVDEAEATGLATVASTRVRPPRLAAAPAAFECSLHQVVPVYDGHVVLGRVEWIHVSDAAMRGDRVIPELLAPVARLGGSLYTTVTDSYRIERPTTTDPAEVGRLAKGPEEASSR